MQMHFLNLFDDSNQMIFLSKLQGKIQQRRKFTSNNSFQPQRFEVKIVTTNFHGVSMSTAKIYLENSMCCYAKTPFMEIK